jgi:hypothetical protein
LLGILYLELVWSLFAVQNRSRKVFLSFYHCVVLKIWLLISLLLCCKK